MAIIKCPGCERDVWDGEDNCPTCKYPLQLTSEKDSLEAARKLHIRRVWASTFTVCSFFTLVISFVRPPYSGHGIPSVAVLLIFTAAFIWRYLTNASIARLGEE
ncbi:MAG: hypothetical protein G3M78_09730 [Candidatus Nitrohelix vancouverensis]|uniref:Zinc ribbon domain-containing protein n=1 Tax=Candidatus Nitrohelix vancouverensis TaxID=2705534 RepID=A0A7T0C333_9BACT|nr:MAG: hypothetical protein G3M78_09730 [Candidatus Nitrohelix vancouverensis]